MLDTPYDHDIYEYIDDYYDYEPADLKEEAGLQQVAKEAATEKERANQERMRDVANKMIEGIRQAACDRWAYSI